MVKILSAMQETRVQSLGREDPLEKEMATHSSILVWEIPWTEDPGGLQSMGSQRVANDLMTKQSERAFKSEITKDGKHWTSQSSKLHPSTEVSGSTVPSLTHTGSSLPCSSVPASPVTKRNPACKISNSIYIKSIKCIYHLTCFLN